MIVLDSNGNPLSTGMGWSVNAARPTNAQILASSLGPVIESLRGHAQIAPDDVGESCGADDTELLRWSLLVSRVLSCPLYINHEYRYSGMLETQENQLIYGNGPHAPGLKMNPAPWFASPDFSWPKSKVAAIVHAPGVKRFTIREINIDGAQYEVNWQAVAQYDVDAVAADPTAQTFSQFLRESPSWSGIAPTEQDGRELAEEVTLENVRIHDTPGTCLFGMARMHCRNLTLGNSVSGRILYRFRGECYGLHTYGFSRTSVARVNAPCVIDGWTYRGEGHVNPWPANDVPGGICAIERTQGSRGTVDLRNIDFDGQDSVFEGTNAIWVKDDCRVTGEVRNLRSMMVSDKYLDRPLSLDIDLRTENSTPPNLAAFSGTNPADIRDARIKWVNRTTNDSASNHDWSYTSAGYQDWSNAMRNAVQISVARQPHHEPDHEQRIDLHVDSDWPQALVLHFPDLAIQENGVWRIRRPDEVIPTYVRLSGRIDNRMAVWIGAHPNWSVGFAVQPEELEPLPLRVIIDGLNCNEVPPGTPYAGDHPWTVHAPLLSVRDRWPLSTTVGVPH